jgi:arginine:ornithine antiporter/lysine permease
MTLLPYLLVAGYGLKLAWTGETYATGERRRSVDWARAVIATLYAAGMLYAGGVTFLLLSAVLYAPGTVLFVLARREQSGTVFTPLEWPVFGVMAAAAIAGLYGLATGAISIWSSL